jgi:hypothetical protein
MSRDVGTLGPGTHSMTLGEATALRPGVYFARLQRGREIQATRLVLVR